MGQVIEFVPRPKVTEWRCHMGGCGNLLGMKHAGGVLIIKYKDVMYEIRGEYEVTGVCRRCGARSTTKNTQLKTLLEDR